MRISTVLLLICATLLPAPAFAGNYGSVQVVSPKAEETIHNNNGDLNVTVAVSPSLNHGRGDYLTLLLDGAPAATGTGRHFKLHGIDRGAHTLAVQVNSADGAVIAVSDPVTFYMWRASRLFPNRR